MRAMSADGVIHDFPDGTDMAVIDRVMKSYAADIPKRADEAAGREAASASVWTEAGPAPHAAAPADLPAIAQYNEPGTETGPDAEAPATTGPVARIADAAAKGFGSDPLGMSAALDATLRNSGILPEKTGGGSALQRLNEGVIGPVAGAADAGARGVRAGMGALAQSLMEVFGEKGGRDALALLGSIPMVHPEMQAALSRGLPADALPAAPPRPQFVSERTMPPDEVGLTPLHRIQDLISHDDMENGVAAADRGAANQSLLTTQNAVMGASDLDGAIAEAAKASGTGDYVPVTVSQVAARDGVGANEAYRRVVEENAARRSPTASPEPVSVEPQSVGSAASREGTPPDQIAMSMSDMKANRRQAELNELLAPAEPGDHTVHVEGSFPTLAERSGTAADAQTETLLRERNADQFYGEGKVLTEANKARVAAIDEHTVPDTTLASMRKDRAARWDALSKDIIPKSKPADLSPAVDWVEKQLSDPIIQEVDPIRSLLEDFHARLYDADGELKTDPASVWGIHNHLQNLLAKAKDPLNQTGAEKFAESQILEAKRLVDQVMNVASDNRFQAALEAYAEDSKAINAGVLMNDIRLNLTNMHGQLMADRFHKTAVSLAKERGDPGIDPSMDISDATMRTIIDVDKDLKRAGLIKVGAPRGAQTNLLGSLAASLGVKAATKVAQAIPVVGRFVKEGSEAMSQYRLDQLTKKHLAPPEGGYVYPSDAP